MCHCPPRACASPSCSMPVQKAEDPRVQMASGLRQTAWGDLCLLAVTCESMACACSCNVKMPGPPLIALLTTPVLCFRSEVATVCAGGWFLARMLCAPWICASRFLSQQFNAVLVITPLGISITLLPVKYY